MAGAAVRWVQLLLLSTVFIFTIITCCSTPVSRDITFLVKGNARQATDPNDSFQGLRLGMTGFCNKGNCATYQDFTDRKEKLAKTRLNNYEETAVAEIAGKKRAADLTKKKWLQLAILYGASAVTAFFTTLLCFLTVKGSDMPAGGQDPYASMGGGESPIVKMSRYAFRGFCVITFIMLLTAWAIAHMEFTKAKDTLMKQGGVDASFGMAWYLGLTSFILTFVAAMLEGAAMATQRKANYDTSGGGGNANYDPNGGGPGGW